MFVRGFPVSSSVSSSPYYPCRLQGTLSLPFSGHWVCTDRRVTTHLNLHTRLRMSGVIPPLPYTPSWSVKKQPYFVLYLKARFQTLLYTKQQHLVLVCAYTQVFIFSDVNHLCSHTVLPHKKRNNCTDALLSEKS
jgi:hypothetical protein